MRGLGPDSFNLTGRRLDLKLDRRDLTYVIAKGNGCRKQGVGPGCRYYWT